MKALIFDSEVIQVQEEEFPVAAPLIWLNCAENTQVGWLVEGGAVVEPEPPEPPTLSQIKKHKLDDLSAYRYAKEVGGLPFGEQTVATDDRSKTLLLGARAIAEKAIKEEAEFSMDYKSDEGFITIDAPTLIALSDAVGSFVQSLFSFEKVHSNQIKALTTVLEVEGYDFTTGWPV